MNSSLLMHLIQTPGVSGREEQVRKLVSQHLTPIVDTVTTDAMGNLIGHRAGKGPKVALVAHMDEVGFLVSKIEKAGFIRVIPVGGVDARVFNAQKVMVHGREDLPGIVGSVPPHLQKKDNGTATKEAVPIAECFIDVGLPAEEVMARVAIGDPVTFATDCWENAASIFGKALDDRVGLYIMLEAAGRIRQTDCDLYLIASVQEEYGLRGVGPAVFGVEPRIMLALEGTVATDMPGLTLPSNIATISQGNGPEIRISDARMLSHRPLVDFLIQTAKNGKVPHQVIVKNMGATDAAQAQTTASGIQTCAVSVPVRYIHAPVGVARKSDIQQTIDLVCEFLQHVAGYSL